MTREKAIEFMKKRITLIHAVLNCDDIINAESYAAADIASCKMAISALRREAEEAKRGVFKTIWETREICPECFEHLSRDWSFCPECGRRTDWTER